MEIRTWRSAIADLKGPPPGDSGALGEGTPGWVWRCDAAISRYHLKTCLFVRFSPFFHVQPKHPNGAIFVNIEAFRPCLGKPSYGAPQWALMVRLLLKERLQSPHKSPVYVTGPFGLFWSFLANMPFWLFWGGNRSFRPFWSTNSEPGWTSRRKLPLEVWLRSARPN